MSVNITINDMNISVPDNMTILEAARSAGIEIPTLCHLEHVNAISACRVCVVEVKGMPTLKPSCSTLVQEGMEIITDSPRVRKARRQNLELICSDHNMSCTECPRGADCVLRELCKLYEVNDEAFGKGYRYPMLDQSKPHLIRDNSKCVLCHRCEATCRVTQTVNAIFVNNRAGETNIGFGLPLLETDCVSCGQCVAACPTGALSVKDDTKAVWKAIYDKKKYVVAAVSPEAACSLGRLFGKEDDPAGLEKTSALLRKMGADLVLDSSAFADKFEKNVKAALSAADLSGGPVLWCTCYAARQFVERFYPQLSGRILPLTHQRNMLASGCKTALSDKDVFFVSIDGCLSAKTERSETPGSMVDAALTARELYTMICQACVSSFTAGEIWSDIAGEAPDKLSFLGDSKTAECRAGFTEKNIEINGRSLRSVEITGLGNARTVLNAPENWDVIRLEACPGGCINGGGMPRNSR